jgi:hypothetical protein
MVVTSSFQRTLNEGHIEEASGLSRLAAALLRCRNTLMDNGSTYQAQGARHPLEKNYFCAKFLMRPLAAAAGATT